MDIKAAYLNANLKEEIYMEAPPGFDIPKGYILKLKKGVYGTKQGCYGAAPTRTACGLQSRVTCG